MIRLSVIANGLSSSKRVCVIVCVCVFVCLYARLRECLICVCE